MTLRIALPFLLGVLGFAVASGSVRAGGPTGPVVDGQPGMPIVCPQQLTPMSWCELEQLYRGAKAGPLPHGYYRGQVIYGPDKAFPGMASTLAECWWKGKYYDACRGELVNRWLVGKAVRAEYGYGPSRFDGQPAVIMDYAGSHFPRWRDVRDEMREIAPGLYLGAMFYHSKPCAEQTLFFVVQRAD